MGINRLRDNIFDRLWAAFELVSGELTYQLNISSKIKKNRTNKTYLYEALQGPGINQFSVFHYRDKYSSIYHIQLIEQELVGIEEQDWN